MRVGYKVIRHIELPHYVGTCLLLSCQTMRIRSPLPLVHRTLTSRNLHHGGFWVFPRSPNQLEATFRAFSVWTLRRVKGGAVTNDVKRTPVHAITLRFAPRQRICCGRGLWVDPPAAEIGCRPCLHKLTFAGIAQPHVIVNPCHRPSVGVFRENASQYILCRTQRSRFCGRTA